MSALFSSVLGNSQKLDGGAMFGNAPRAVWSKWMEPDAEGRIDLACRTLLIEIGNRKILCETGIGNFFPPKLKERFGVEGNRNQLLVNLNTLGVQENEITDVILSHLHFDHAGGLLSDYQEDKAHELHFPKAHYYVGKTAWERARNPHSRDQASFIPELIELLKKSNRLHVIESSQCELLPKEFTFRYSNGHTPGQMHTVYQGKERKLIFCGDLIPGRHWVHLPITMGYDRNPEQLIDEKEALYQEWVPEGSFLYFTHDPIYCLSRVQCLDGKYSARDLVKELKREALDL